MFLEFGSVGIQVEGLQYVGRLVVRDWFLKWNSLCLCVSSPSSVVNRMFPLYPIQLPLRFPTSIRSTHKHDHPKVLLAKWRFYLVVMMVEVDNVRWSGVDGLSFWLLVLSSEAARSDMPMFWVWPMRNQWLWAHFSLSMLRESRERSIKRRSWQNSLTHWVPDAALIGRMAQRVDRIVTMDGD